MSLSFEKKSNGYLVSNDPARLDPEPGCDYLLGTYWASDVSREQLLRSIRNSLAFGLYHGMDQIGFARVVTDYARFAYLADVFVLEEHRGRSLGRWLVQCILDHPELRSIRKWMLTTRDAHGLYRSFGFAEVDVPEWLMERRT